MEHFMLQCIYKYKIVYGIKCEDPGCQETYVGETQQSLKARMSQHRKPSTAGENSNSAVFTHLDITGHTFKTENVVVLDREEDWFRRGVKEAVWERVENPTLNKRGGLRFQLSHAWNSAIKTIPCCLSPGHPTGRRQVDMQSCQQ